MSYHHFLFTYSISANGNDEKRIKVANKVRDKIANLEKWTKLENVETTFVGELFLYEDDIEEKRNEAINNIKLVIMDIVSDLDAHNDVLVDIALSVDQLGSHIITRF